MREEKLVLFLKCIHIIYKKQIYICLKMSKIFMLNFVFFIRTFACLISVFQHKGSITMDRKNSTRRLSDKRDDRDWYRTKRRKAREREEEKRRRFFDDEDDDTRKWRKYRKFDWEEEK
jgi:hypothetical protein